MTVSLHCAARGGLQDEAKRWAYGFVLGGDRWLHAGGAARDGPDRSAGPGAGRIALDAGGRAREVTSREEARALQPHDARDHRARGRRGARVGGGRVAHVFIAETQGYFKEDLGLEDVRDNWDTITNRDGFEAFVRTEREVAELLRTGRLRVLDQQPIVARAIEQIMGVGGELDLQLA